MHNWICTCIQISQEAGKVVWFSHLLKYFPQFVVIHTVKGFGIVNKTEIDIFSGTLLLFLWCNAAAAAAKSLQSRPTLCDPIDGSPPGSPIPGILQARTPEWAAISFSNVWKWKVKVKSLSRVWLLATPWTTAHQASPSMGFSRQEYWSGVPLPSPYDTIDVGNLISGSSPFSKSSLNIWKFTVHILLNPGLENFKHYFGSVWDQWNCVVVWTFFGIAYLWDWNENWPFPVLWPLLSFPNLLAYWVQHFHSIIF